MQRFFYLSTVKDGITDEGKRLKNEVAPYIENHFKEITADIPENEIEIYEQVLGKIDRSLDALLDKHKY